MADLFAMPHHEAVKAVATGAPVHLSFNPVEYHGPHLPLFCDRLICRGIQAELIERMSVQFPQWPVLTVDSFDFGVEPTSGRGSVDLRYRHMRKAVVEICEALVDLGAKRVVLSTFHGSPLHNIALQDGVDVFLKAGLEAIAPFHLVMEVLLDVDYDRFRPAFAHIPDPALREELLFGLSLDFHAGFFETSMALAHAEANVSNLRMSLPQCPSFGTTQPLRVLSWLFRTFGQKRIAREMAFTSRALGWPRLRPFPGYTSQPALASASSGRFFTNDILDRYMKAIEGVFLHGLAPPEPVMKWTKVLSLGGRIVTTKVPLKDMALLPAPESVPPIE